MSLSRGWLLLPHFGDCMHPGQPDSHGHSVMTSMRIGPLLGEHNDYIFQELLGVSEEELNKGYVEGSIA